MPCDIKHFIAGGFGIRTLCDIVTYAQQHEDAIDQDAGMPGFKKQMAACF